MRIKALTKRQREISAAASVEAVKVPEFPLPIPCGGADHRDVLARVERPDAAELKRQCIQAAERGAAEPAAITSAVDFQRFVQAI